jgi:glycosyltransferase involved in cell wall biosynthesis
MPYVQDALNSVLNQTWRDFEIIVVDGGSTDGTVEYVQKLSSTNERVRLIYQNEGKIGEARNIGIKAANYDWIACLDADDIASPEWLESEVKFLEDNPDYVFVSCDTEYIDLHGSRTGIRKRHILTDPPNYNPLLDGNVPHQGSLYSKDAALSVGGYRDFPQGEDYDLFLRLSEHYKLGFLSKVLTHTRILASGLTLKGFEEQRIYWMYAKDCAIARRRGEEEPEFEYWLSNNAERIRKKKEWTGQRLWTLAGASITEGKFFKALEYGIKAFLANPKYVISKSRTYTLNILRK